MEVAFLVLLIGALSLSSADAQCAGCSVKHPQHHFCDATFVMKVTIIDVILDRQGGDKLINAEINRSWKKGPSSGDFQFYAPSSFCGATFDSGDTYVVTGTKEETSDGRRYWLHGSCDYMIKWDDMSDQQKAGFKGGYKARCGECQIAESLTAASVKVEDIAANDYPLATTYWTPTGCYYNPLMTRQFVGRKGSSVVDCEDVYGLCKPNEADKCQWTLTPDYERCLKERDDFVKADSSAFAITRVEQCDVYTNKRKRKNCRQRFRELQAEMGADEELIFYR
uniref:Tensilin n=1 Tax=Cucumaria frondosa TaxID=36326 RepID=Q962H0_CUCFR|nr:tensilin [Cucumaria frondosa]